MTDFRKSLVDRMIKVYGFEHPVVKNICNLCEVWEDDTLHNKILEGVVLTHEQHPVNLEEEADEDENFEKELLTVVGVKDGKFYKKPRE